jgi:hypothetical protein
MISTAVYTTKTLQIAEPASIYGSPPAETADRRHTSLYTTYDLSLKIRYEE